MRHSCIKYCKSNESISCKRTIYSPRGQPTLFLEKFFHFLLTFISWTFRNGYAFLYIAGVFFNIFFVFLYSWILSLSIWLYRKRQQPNVFPRSIFCSSVGYIRKRYAMFNAFSLPGSRCIDGSLLLVPLLPSKDRNSGSRMLFSKVFSGFPDTLFSAVCCWHFYKH